METAHSTASPAPATAGAAGSGGSGPAPGPTSEALRQAHDAVVARHANAGSFKPGQPAWNKGAGRSLAPAGSEPAGPAAEPVLSPALQPAVAPPVLVDKETVKRLVELALGAMDKTLQVQMATGWYQISGDKNLALQQADFYALKQEQKEAISLCAGLCAEKYGAALQYLPEVGLVVTTGTYLCTWLIGFNKLKQAILVKKQNTEAKANEPAKAADK